MFNDNEKLEKLNTELCNLIGITPSEFCERTSDGCMECCLVYNKRYNREYCIKHVEMLPKLYQPDNFVKLIETKILTGCTLIGFMSTKNIFIGSRHGFLVSLKVILEQHFIDDATKENIKENLKGNTWYFD